MADSVLDKTLVVGASVSRTLAPLFMNSSSTTNYEVTTDPATTVDPNDARARYDTIVSAYIVRRDRRNATFDYSMLLRGVHPGSSSVTLTATDSLGQGDSYTFTVTVKEPVSTSGSPDPPSNTPDPPVTPPVVYPPGSGSNGTSPPDDTACDGFQKAMIAGERTVYNGQCHNAGMKQFTLEATRIGGPYLEMVWLDNNTTNAGATGSHTNEDGVSWDWWKVWICGNTQVTVDCFNPHQADSDANGEWVKILLRRPR